MTGPRQPSYREAADKRAQQDRIARLAKLREADLSLRRMLKDSESTLRRGADLCNKVVKSTPREELQEIRRAQEAIKQIRQALNCIAAIRHLTTPSQMDPDLMAENDRIDKKKTLWGKERKSEAGKSGVSEKKPLFQTLLEEG